MAPSRVEGIVADFIVAHDTGTSEFTSLVAMLFARGFVAAGAIARIDRISFEVALYVSLITASTVGYGEIAPRVRATRMIAAFPPLIGVLVTGLVVVAAVHSMQVALGTANPV